MSEEQISCTFVSGDAAGDEGIDACAVFKAEVAALERDDIAALSLTQVSPYSARAVALGKDGEEMLVLDFDVMDAPLDEAKWAGFARSFVRQLEADRP
ncbi:hypothetical protein K3152_13145 [Qipengyuania sp. 1NDH17]|uniref:DUF2470 domain-containing protein n=1 Tax=Qipengyuania polymorpha TaxID=2867234 RepID=A0ABS7J058_9SPHN|nr:hypothetical protein [Qipengyuania polymorpha]MBX7459197.1 hypothetical protein [Qipengyuania polymorpha]